ncbi:MAG: CpsD/CapB family tyrosine-protein kinase [Longicatena sp.]
MKLPKIKRNRDVSTKKDQFDQKEVFRQLRTNIEYSYFNNKQLQVISFSSTSPKEGKSTVSSNLAMISIAKYHNVLIIDCDLRKPGQHKIFDVSNAKGLSDLLFDLDNVNINDNTYFQRFKENASEGRLYLLTSGTKVPNPQELLGSEKFEILLEKLRKRFDFIILDCPPVTAVSDAIPVARLSDGLVFVISAMDTKKNDAKNAITQFKRNGVNILGIVLTKVDNEQANYYNYYY